VGSKGVNMARGKIEPNEKESEADLEAEQHKEPSPWREDRGGGHALLSHNRPRGSTDRKQVGDERGPYR
jgi:hypothetical protein